jgi:hypothetical protein
MLAKAALAQPLADWKHTWLVQRQHTGPVRVLTAHDAIHQAFNAALDRAPHPWTTIHIAGSELGARAVLSAVAEACAFAAQANHIVVSHWPTTVRHAPWPGFCIQWRTNPPAVCSKAPGVKHARLSVVPIKLALGNALRAAQLGGPYDWVIIYLGHDETDTTNTRNMLGKLLRA